jgi:hypothetical protein
MLIDCSTQFVSFYPRKTAKKTPKNRANFPRRFLSQLKLRDANTKKEGLQARISFLQTSGADPKLRKD